MNVDTIFDKNFQVAQGCTFLARLEAVEYAGTALVLLTAESLLEFPELVADRSEDFSECLKSLAVLVEDPAFVLANGDFKFIGACTHQEAIKHLDQILTMKMVLTAERVQDACRILFNFLEQEQESRLAAYEAKHGVSIHIDAECRVQIGNYT